MPSRRLFLLGTVGAAAALTVGWSLLPPRQRLQGSTAPAPDAFNGWVAIGSDDLVSIVMPRSEMGQGVHTALAMLLADELDADWPRVRLLPAPIDAIYNSVAAVTDGLPLRPDDDATLHRLALWLGAKALREVGAMITGGSTSVRDLWQPMREAGASARAMLVGAAAQAWGVPAADVSAERGVLRHAASGRQARFGEMAAAARQRALPEHVVLKTPAQWQLIGRPMPRLDAAAKADGSAQFGIDVRPPGLLYASVLMCPTLNGFVAQFDASAASALPGVRKVVSVAGYHGGTAGIAVIAEQPWQALQALRQVRVQWDELVKAATLSSTEAVERLAQRVRQEPDAGFAYQRRGDVRQALAGAARTVSAEYRVPWLAHATLEPQNCTVLVQPGVGATVWAPTQVPGFARYAAAQALKLPSEQVQLHVTLLGGGFGRRLEVDFIAQAAAIAAHLPGVPVQTFWSREQDTQHDFYRPAAAARLQAGLDAQGRLVAWQQLSAGQAILPQVMRRLFDVSSVPLDKSTAEGAFDQPYEWPAARVAHRIVELPVPVGFWRSVGHSHQAFFKECFIDEVAFAAGQDAVAFRAALLQRHPRERHVLERAAALAGWGTPAPAGRARGVALHASFGSTVAQVAEVALEGGSRIRVHHVWCVIDCGTALNPNLIRQQMESGIVFGLTAALYGAVEIVQGRVVPSNFHQYPLLRIDECPAITTEIVASTEPPEGVGETATPPIAPAVANAIFALTGKRLRELPLKIA